MSFFELLIQWPKPYISGTDLHNILDKSDDSRHGIIKRAVQKGFLEPIRRDLYLITTGKKYPLVNAYELAGIIYGPSYISFESALSFHGWIPEAVRSTTSATVKRSNQFDTPIGIYDYEHIPIQPFSLGVKSHVLEGVSIFIASPLKALADMIYSRKSIWHSLEDLYEDLRIEPENYNNFDEKLLKDLVENYPNSRVKNTLKRWCS